MDTSNPLHHMLNPDSVAFVGANNMPTTMGTVQMLQTLSFGFKGRIYPVHRKEKTVLGIKAYSSLLDIPDPVDLAVITVPARFVPGIFEDCAAKKIHYAVVTSGGFSESGTEGKKLEGELLELAHRHNIRFIGPNCLGILNPHSRLNLTMLSYQQPPGAMGLASQSGTYITQVLKYLYKMGIGYSRALSVGNKADIDLVDCLEYLGEDPKTRAIALYIEGLKRPRLFLKTAREISRHKPIVALYVGGTDAGARSSASHTGAICSPAKLYSDMFRQAGIIEASSVENLYQWTWALANQPFPRSNRIAILTHSGGPATSIADACNKNGLEVPEFSIKTQEAIRPFVPPTASIRNPVDLTFTTEPAIMARVLPPIIMEDPNIDAMIIHGLMASSWAQDIKQAAGGLFGDIPFDQIEEMVEGPVRDLSALPGKYNKPIICSTFMAPDIEVGTRKLHEFNIPTYEGPEKAVTAMSAMVRYKDIKK